MDNPIVYFLCVALMCILAAAFIVVFFGAPGRCARRRGHEAADTIVFLGYAGLVFFPLWIVALVWAYSGPNNAEAASEQVDYSRRESERSDWVDADGLPPDRPHVDVPPLPPPATETALQARSRHDRQRQM